MLSPSLSVAPVPLMRSAACMTLGGAVVGMTIVGALPAVPMGDAQAIGANPATAKGVVEHLVDTVPIVVVVVVGMVTVGGFDFWKKSAAEPMITIAMTRAMTLR